MKEKVLSNYLVRKILITFLFMIILMGICYILITLYFSNHYFEEASQKLNAHVANHLIDEKFQDAAPFLDDGSINKPLFGDIMHDMMAVNQGIEVYLLSTQGEVLYSVVLEHSNPDQPLTKVSMDPIRRFLQNDGDKFVLGDDPRNPDQQKIFSAAPFNIDGHQGYIYIILAGQRFEEVASSLLGSYSVRLGIGSMILTLVFTTLIGILILIVLTKNLREIIFSVRRFKEGDLNSRIQNASKNDLSILATTFNEMADTLVSNIEKLKSVETLRQELIANISHDLRTPLSIMQGYIETLEMKGKKLSEKEQNDYLGIIRKSTEKLSHMVNQLFEFSKLEAKQIEPQKEPFVIGELAQDIYHKYQQLAQDRKISLKLDMEEGLPLVFADISLVERAIQNLMDNALKYTPEKGEVFITLHSNNQNVEISIRDSGPGIPENEQSYIFERFKRASTAGGGISGSGLGLAIVKKIVEIHESSIRVISKPDAGTTFQFSLPAYQHG